MEIEEYLGTSSSWANFFDTLGKAYNLHWGNSSVPEDLSNYESSTQDNLGLPTDPHSEVGVGEKLTSEQG